MVTALVTGFDAFGGETVNPALEAVRRLPPRLGDDVDLEEIRIVTRELPTLFGRSRAVLHAAMREVRPDIVLCVGQAGGRAELSLERVAINVDDARIPDNAGRQPVDEPIEPRGPAAYFSTLPVKAAVRALRAAGLPAGVSQTAGTFVCNHIFYGLMHLIATDFPGVRGGFLHIPYLPEQAAHHPGQPSMAADLVTQGLGIVLRATIATRVDIAVSEGAVS
ncbi:MAG TPA: pyroglutamyl-peptidase I [Stellaceae bacterium]|nr:pyroglutamyl-peptidase I [Stellaceae bacterium]